MRTIKQNIEYDIVVKMKPKAVRKLLLGAAIQTPTETTCWDGGEHEMELIIDAGDWQSDGCLKCGAIGTSEDAGESYYLFTIPTMFEALSQGKDETDAD